MPNETTFNRVIASWLRDEWHYECFDHYRSNITERIVTDPNLENPEENELRKEILMSNRGEIIRQLPPDTKWFVVPFNKEDISRTFLIPMRNGWTARLTNGTCRLSDALSENSIGKIPFEDAERIRMIALKNDYRTSLIFIGSSLVSTMTVIEGNHRLVACAINSLSKNVQDPLIQEIFVGISPAMKECHLNAEKYFEINPTHILKPEL